MKPKRKLVAGILCGVVLLSAFLIGGPMLQRSWERRATESLLNQSVESLREDVLLGRRERDDIVYLLGRALVRGDLREQDGLKAIEIIEYLCRFGPRSKTASADLAVVVGGHSDTVAMKAASVLCEEMVYQQLLYEGNPQVRLRMATALGNAQRVDRDVLISLRYYYERETEQYIRVALLRAMVNAMRLRPDRAADYYIGLVQTACDDADESVRTEAAKGLELLRQNGIVKEEPAVPAPDDTGASVEEDP